MSWKTWKRKTLRFWPRMSRLKWYAVTILTFYTLLTVIQSKSYLRKLKFQYLEQNAKDKYVKSIVSDIDDAPLFTDEDNKQLAFDNQQKKERLKTAKNQLHEVHSNIRTLAPLVEQGKLLSRSNPHSFWFIYKTTSKFVKPRPEPQNSLKKSLMHALLCLV